MKNTNLIIDTNFQNEYQLPQYYINKNTPFYPISNPAPHISKTPKYQINFIQSQILQKLIFLILQILFLQIIITIIQIIIIIIVTIIFIKIIKQTLSNQNL